MLGTTLSARDSRRTVRSSGARRTTTSKNSRQSVGTPPRSGASAPITRAATGELGSRSSSRSRSHPAGTDTSTTARTPDAPSPSTLRGASKSLREISATAGTWGNSFTNCATRGIAASSHRCTERNTASTARRRTCRIASSSESPCSAMKQSWPAASTLARSSGVSTVATVAALISPSGSVRSPW